ncbi:ATP-binding protein [Candidatus Gottesmanbacteria bacterium]|nr:ATP-binding protein [Candidatus Gottesmanbacteria bacterium]
MDIRSAIKYFIDPMPEDVAIKHDPTAPLDVRDIIAPPSIEVDFNFVKVGDQYSRTLFVVGYPRFVSANWLEPLISFNHTLDVAMYVYPTKSEEVLENLKRKVGEMEATIQSDMKRGRVIEPSVQVALEDALSLQQELAKGAERFFQFGLYVTIPAKSLEELDKTTKQVEATLGSLLIITKKAVLAMDDGLRTTLPMGQDRIVVTRNMDTTSLATTFPFTTSELSANEGILYGMNEHNGSLIIFDRFSLENANMVVFGKSVARWEPVLVRENGVIRQETIGNLIESLIQKHGVTHTDEELEGVKNPGLEVFSYNRSLHGEWTQVSVAARKPFSRREHLYKLTTRSGREITVTADHSLITLRNGRVSAVRGQAIQPGDAVPLPRIIHESNDAPTHIHPHSLPGVVWPATLPTTIPITTPLLTLLGLTTSEGLVRPSTLTIYNTDSAVLKAIQTSAVAIGAHVAPRNTYPDHQTKGYNIQPNVYARLFIALGAGGNSGEKRVPPIVFTLPKERIAEYLRAYFEGDGTVSSKDVSCTSKSKQLVSDIAYLLLYFGIIGRIHTKHKRATNGHDAGDTYYELSVSGADHLKTFAGEVGFLTRRKTMAFGALLGKTPNTNVDTIPTLGPVIKKLHTMLYPGDQVRAPVNFSPLSRGVFSPSPQQVHDIILAARQRIAHLENLRGQLLSQLPNLNEVIARGTKQKKLNRLLWKHLGQTWRLMKHKTVTPRVTSVLRAYETVTGERFTAPEVIKHTMYECFREMGVSLLVYNKTLWTSVVLEARRHGDIAYPTLYDAATFLKKHYRSLQLKLRHAKRILTNLEVLASSDLFWDPVIVKKPVKHNEQYVYDLTVDNHVFLTGHGGLFVHNSGGGKSYMVKLEAMRSLMFDTEVIIIDPENEYQTLTHALGGEYIRFHFGTTTKINPFDLSLLHSTGGAESELNQKVLSLHGFFRVVMGKLTPTEDALLDRALILAYKQKGITPDPATQSKEPPLMEDLYKALVGMEEPLARGLADRIEKFVKGSLVGIFDQQTNVEIRNPLTVFSIRDLEEELRPIAMYLILDFIWTKIRRDLKRRLLIVDEAWYMMKFPDSAAFMNSIAKRARKYYLGVTTISQDVEDFLSTDLGKAIIQNSSLQVLLKQSPAAIDKVAEVFYLSEGEKHLLLSADIGEGLFFAGPAHAAVRVIASPVEHELVTTNPKDILDQTETQSGTDDHPGSVLKPAGRTLPVSNRPIFTVETVNGMNG